ncbi:hypothetical protein JXA84_02050 [candidate division WOR-3 bacterium]|nr:hypothetical protein [candidate division WOR-3 bacterium]
MEENSQAVKPTFRSFFWSKTAATLEIIIGALLCFFPLSVILGIFLIISGSHLYSISNSFSRSENEISMVGETQKYYKYKTVVYSLILLFFIGVVSLLIMFFSAMAGAFSGASYAYTSDMHNFWQF